GIGRAAALHFAGKGWFVGLFDIDQTGLDELHAEIGEERACKGLLDVSDLESAREAVGVFAGRTGNRMDALFNCAGILQMGYFDEIDIRFQKKIVDVNFVGVIHCTHAAMDLLKNTPGARVINMSSGSAVYGSPEVAVYSATKFAVRGLTEALNIEFEPLGVHVCDIMAFYVRTPMIVDAKEIATSVDRLGINLTPDQVASVVWKAAHGKKVHWRVGGMLKFTEVVYWLFPFLRRTLTKTMGFKSR
ncbi:MAG: SDR family oxidoreductase, partial [Desulfobacterales bacterium]|nr:SDR family oxidoreductase [Desulfobacterales bacterium]